MYRQSVCGRFFRNSGTSTVLIDRIGSGCGSRDGRGLISAAAGLDAFQPISTSQRCSVDVRDLIGTKLQVI
jgi:hypothetical protein